MKKIKHKLFFLIIFISINFNINAQSKKKIIASQKITIDSLTGKLAELNLYYNIQTDSLNKVLEVCEKLKNEYFQNILICRDSIIQLKNSNIEKDSLIDIFLNKKQEASDRLIGTFNIEGDGIYNKLVFKEKNNVSFFALGIEFPTKFEIIDTTIFIKTDKSDLILHIKDDVTLIGEGWAVGTYKKERNNTFKDLRDGKIYKTVKIGNQIWMAENLAYKPKKGNFYPKKGNDAYVKNYGYLYDWNTAIKNCPDGWHIPSNEEWLELINYLGGENYAGGKMKSTELWKNPNTAATNEVGFNAKPAGNMEGKNIGDKINLELVGVENIAIFWSSSEFHKIWAKYFGLFSFNGAIGSSNVDKGEAYLSVRCIKNKIN